MQCIHLSEDIISIVRSNIVQKNGIKQRLSHFGGCLFIS